MGVFHCLPLTLIALTIIPSIECFVPGRGWGKDIKWVKLDKAKEISKKEKKPIMVIIHNSTCEVSQELMKEFAEYQTRKKEDLTSKLVMVNMADDEWPDEAAWMPDGAYVPRILFLSPVHQMVEPSIYNKKNSEYFQDKYKYFYYDVRDIIEVMEEAIKTTIWPVDKTTEAEKAKKSSSIPKKMAEKKAKKVADKAAKKTVDAGAGIPKS